MAILCTWKYLGAKFEILDFRKQGIININPLKNLWIIYRIIHNYFYKTYKIKNWLHLCIWGSEKNEEDFQRVYMEQFSNRNFCTIHWELCKSGSFFGLKRDAGAGIYRRIPAVKEAIWYTLKVEKYWMWIISMSKHIHEIHARKLHIGVTLHVARNPCGA